MTEQAKNTRSALLAFLVIGLLLVGIVAVVGIRSGVFAPAATPTPVYGVTPIDPPRALSDFVLTSTSGQPLSLSDLKGKWTLLFFGYTHCPDFCPLTLAHWRSIHALLGDAAAQVNFVFVSVDPERDTPDVLARYLSRFDATFIGLTGDDAVLGRVGPDYGLYYQLNKAEGENYSVDHTTQSYLIDPQGQMIDMFSFDTAEADVAATIQKAIASA